MSDNIHNNKYKGTRKPGRKNNIKDRYSGYSSGNNRITKAKNVHTEPGDIRNSMPDAAEIKDILGVISTFKINKLIPIGAFLSYVSPATDSSTDSSAFSASSVSSDTGLGNFEILLPKNELEGKDFKRGDLLQAFIYLDSDDRPVATLRKPMLTIGELAILKCNQVTPLGAFLDWGLMKDLFLPFKEQTVKIKSNDKALVTLYLDKSSRLCASMKIYRLLKNNSPYKPNDHVTGFVYELSEQHGAYVAVDNIFSAMIPIRELVTRVRVGEQIQLRVSKVLPDGKLELSMREPGYLQLDDDCKKIYQELENSSSGFLPYHDKTESLILKNKFNMSKTAFKRAIGHLYRQGLLVIKEDGIYLNKT